MTVLDVILDAVAGTMVIAGLAIIVDFFTAWRKPDGDVK